MPLQAYWFNFHGNAMYGAQGAFQIGTTYHLVNPQSLRPCFWGYHASVHPFDAFLNVQGTHVDRVILGGRILKHENKHAATERTHLARRDALPMLRDFELRMAQEAIALWPEAPAHMKQWAKTGKGKEQARRALSRSEYLYTSCPALYRTLRDILDGDTKSAVWGFLDAMAAMDKTPWWRRVFAKSAYDKATERIRAEFKARVDALFEDLDNKTAA